VTFPTAQPPGITWPLTCGSDVSEAFAASEFRVVTGPENVLPRIGRGCHHREEMIMGLFSSSKSDKLPATAFRGRNEETGKKQNYLLRWGCGDDKCDGLFRSKAKSDAHASGHKWSKNK
jgi:hypothetical protein